MAEQIPSPELVAPNLRVTFMLSSMGFDGEVDGRSAEAMRPFAEIGYLQDGERFDVAPSWETTGYLVDWRICRSSLRKNLELRGAIIEVTQWTVALKNFVNLDGAEITAGKYSTGNEVAFDDPNDAWPEMTEVSSIVRNTIEAGSLPDNITADQFRY